MVKNLYFIDSMTKDRTLRMTAFSDDVRELIEDLGKWIRNNEIHPEDLRYADIFSAEGKKHPNHVATFLLNEEGGLDLMGTPGSRLNPYRRGVLSMLMFKRAIKLIEMRNQKSANDNSAS